MSTFGLIKNARRNLHRRRKTRKTIWNNEENGDVATVAWFILCLKSAEKERKRKKEKKRETKERTKASGKRREKIVAPIAFSHSKRAPF